MTENDPLDRLLAQASPRTTAITPEVSAEFQRMASAAGRRPARRRTAVAIGVASLALIASGGAAAAGADFPWNAWARTPDAVYQYTLPSGKVCELRAAWDNPATGAVVRDILSDTDLAAAIDVQGWIQKFRETPGAVSIPDARGPRYAPGSDQEYDRAVQFAVEDYVGEQLRTRGVPATDPAMSGVFASTCSIEFSSQP